MIIHISQNDSIILWCLPFKESNDMNEKINSYATEAVTGDARGSTLLLNY